MYSGHGVLHGAPRPPGSLSRGRPRKARVKPRRRRSKRAKVALITLRPYKARRTLGDRYEEDHRNRNYAAFYGVRCLRGGSGSYPRLCKELWPAMLLS